VFNFENLIAQANQQNDLVQTIDRLARAPLSKVLLFAVICTIIRIAAYLFTHKTPIHLRSGIYHFWNFLNGMGDALVYAAIAVFMIIRPFCIQTFYIPSGSMVDTLLEGDYIVANKFIYRFTEPQRGDIVVFKPPKESAQNEDPNPARYGAALRGEDIPVKTKDQDFIKRLIGIPGDIIEIRKSKLYRNGKLVDEPWVKMTTDRRDSSSGRIVYDLIPKSEWTDSMVPDFKLVKYNDRYVPVSTMDLLVNQGETSTAYEYQVAKRGSSLEDNRPDFALAAKLASLPPAPVPPGYFLMMGDNRMHSFDGRGWGLVPRKSIIGRSEFIWLPISRIKQTR